MRKKKNGIELLPPHPQAVKVSKEQAAGSEIATAIRLFFRQEDLVSALVLAGAARDILRGIAKSRGAETMWDKTRDIVKEEYQDAYFDVVHASYNFLKHGSRDANQTFDRFTPDDVTGVILQAVHDFRAVFGQVYFEMLVFQWWVMVRNPTFVKAENVESFAAQRALIAWTVTSDMPFAEAVEQAARVIEAADVHPEHLSVSMMRQHFAVNVPRGANTQLEEARCA
jgi:hypothetical protein